MATIRKRLTRWQVQVRKKGHRPVSKSFTSKADAQLWARQVESKIDLGTYLDVSEARKRLLADVIQDYISKVLPTRKARKSSLSRCRLLQRRLGHLSLASISSSHIAQYRDGRRAEVAPQSIRHELSLLGHILNTAIREWGIHLPHGNPVGAVKSPACSRARDRRLDIHEEQHLLAALRESYEMPSIVEIALETGMRRGEICGMRWTDIDLTKSTLHIPTTKTGAPREIPLSPRAKAVLLALPRRIDGSVFSLSADSITQAFDRACKRAGITNLRFHDLRHEATSRLFEKGLAVMEVATITGHKDLRMLQRYTHLRAEDLARKLFSFTK